MSDDILLGEAEQTALKWAMGMPWFDRFADPATREAALSDLCVRLEAIGHDDEIEELSQRVHALRKYADGVEAERNRLRTVVDAAQAYRQARLKDGGHATARQALYRALDQLDGTGITGLGSEAGDEQFDRVWSTIEHVPMRDLIPEEEVLRLGRKVDESSAGGATNG